MRPQLMVNLPGLAMVVLAIVAVVALIHWW